METYRKTAVVVGILYIIGTVSGFLSVIATGSSLEAPSTAARIAADANQIILGALLVLAMGFALAMVPLLLYPILKKWNDVLALGYVVFRGALETVACLILALCWLTPVMTVKTHMPAGAAAESTFQATSELLFAVGATSVPLGYIAFSLGALMLYAVLYRSRLVPRWLSGWGIVAVVPYLAAALTSIVGLVDANSDLSSLMYLPMLIQEMVMAVWLIVKGFSLPALAVMSAGQHT